VKLGHLQIALSPRLTVALAMSENADQHRNGRSTFSEHRVLMRRKSPHRYHRQAPPARPFQLPFAAVVGLTAVVAFALTWFAITPSAPRAAVASYVKVRTTDQHYSGCTAVRAAGRKDIPSWDPSYRSWMDGDGDGLACEPPRGGY